MGLTLLRHTTPTVEPGTCYGRLDLDLAASFADEFAAVASSLPNVDHIVSSPLKRCRRLADFLADRYEVPKTFDERLQEMHFGAWEGKLWRDIPRAELDAWAADFMHARPHGGESVADLRERTAAAIRELQIMRGRTLVVTHAGVIKAALAAGETAEDHNTQIEFGGFVTLPPDGGNQS